MFKYAELSIQYEICLLFWLGANKRLMVFDTFFPVLFVSWAVAIVQCQLLF